MAEDTDYEDEELEEGQGPTGKSQSRGRGQSPTGTRNKPCNARIDQLAIPSKRIIWTTYKDYGRTFEPQRKDLLKKKIQELFSMNAQQAEEYFMKKRKEVREAEKRRLARQKILKMYKMKKNLDKREKAFRKFRRIFEIGIRFARTHEVPPLVTARVRNMADVILEQLCEIRGIEGVPVRTDSDKMAIFLMAVADWTAITMERIYFNVQLKKNQDLEEIERMVRTMGLERAGAGDERGDDVLSREVKVEDMEGAGEEEGLTETVKTEEGEVTVKTEEGEVTVKTEEGEVSVKTEPKTEDDTIKSEPE